MKFQHTWHALYGRVIALGLYTKDVRYLILSRRQHLRVSTHAKTKNHASNILFVNLV
jgi:hypothetical protein